MSNSRTPMSSEELQKAARDHLWLHFTRMGAYGDSEVPIIVRGDGCYLEDSHGKRYLDALAGLFTVIAVSLALLALWSALSGGRAWVVAFATEQIIRQSTGRDFSGGAGERWQIGTTPGFNRTTDCNDSAERLCNCYSFNAMGVHASMESGNSNFGGMMPITV